LRDIEFLPPTVVPTVGAAGIDSGVKLLGSEVTEETGDVERSVVVTVKEQAMPPGRPVIGMSQSLALESGVVVTLIVGLPGHTAMAV